MVIQILILWMTQLVHGKLVAKRFYSITGSSLKRSLHWIDGFIDPFITNAAVKNLKPMFAFAFLCIVATFHRVVEPNGPNVTFKRGPAYNIFFKHTKHWFSCSVATD